jgi:catechol 2,3-dioxygenase-like lactoylglutathione lyase family enzyme
MSSPNLTQLNIVARDFDASVTFYRRLGLNIAERSAPDLGHRHAQATLPNGFGLEFDNQELARLYNAGWASSRRTTRSGVLAMPSSLTRMAMMSG